MKNLNYHPIAQPGNGKPSLAPNKANIVNGKLSFEREDGFNRAISEGFFFLPIPDDLDMSDFKRLCLNFHKPKLPNLPKNKGENIYRGYKEPSNGMFTLDAFQNGYFDRSNNQAESLLLTQDILASCYPDTFNDMMRRIAELGSLVLTNILTAVGVPQTLWQDILGPTFEKKPECNLFLNHFRPELDCSGAVRHKDSGWVTVLYSEQPGLEAYIQGKWIPIDPIPGYFTINFGMMLDVLTQHLKQPIVAALHRVVKQKKHNRFSIATFMEPPFGCQDRRVYTCQDGRLVFLKSYQVFIEELFRRYEAQDGTESFSVDSI